MIDWATGADGGKQRLDARQAFERGSATRRKQWRPSDFIAVLRFGVGEDAHFIEAAFPARRYSVPALEAPRILAAGISRGRRLPRRWINDDFSAGDGRGILVWSP